jgi:hypothetical protein
VSKLTGKQIRDNSLTGDDIDEASLVITLNDVVSDGNTTNLTINSGDIIPSTDITYDLGSSSVSWNQAFLKDLSVSGVGTYNTIEYSNSNTMKFNQYYLGNASGSYFSANEYQKVVTIIPSGTSQNYQVIGRITAQNAGETHTVYFNAALRSGDPLPDLFWSTSYHEEYNGSRYIDPQLWTKQTTTAGFIFAFKTLGTIYGNVTVDIDVVPRNATLKANVTINDSVSSEQASIDAGYTANDMTKVVSKKGQEVTFENDLTVNGAVMTEGVGSATDLSLDADGGQIYMKDGGVTYLTFNVDGTQDEIIAVGHMKLIASADITLNAQQGDIYFQDNGTQRMRIEDTTGDIAVGSHAPSYRLDVRDNTSSFVMNIQQDSSLAGADMLRMDFSTESNPTGQIIYVYDQDNDRIYQVVGNGAGGSTVNTSFTAGHDTVVPQSSSVVPGMIIESTGVVWYKPTSITSETALPKCQLSSTNGSKKVFGVVAGYPAPETPSEIEQPYVHNGFVMAPSFPAYGREAGVASNEWQIGTMSLGEGVVWVTDHNGNIENGDYIESSEIPGYGRKQDDDIMRSRTVAKCTENINWDEITEIVEHNGVSYKKYLACCTFHCG